MADVRDTLRETLACAEAWEPDVRLLGNVRAGDMAAALRHAESAERELAEVKRERDAAAARFEELEPYAYRYIHDKKVRECSNCAHWGEPHVSGDGRRLCQVLYDTPRMNIDTTEPGAIGTTSNFGCVLWAPKTFENACTTTDAHNQGKPHA